ncbi:MAG: V-type ATP synthase subunit D [Geobacter sp.]|nr:MAG: V-type ATP synthase subunit D [Geobacter sp.]
MIPPTRTNLLLSREKIRSVSGSIAILKARRLALIREFLAISAPFLRSREEVKGAYGLALGRLHLALGHEGDAFVASLASPTARPLDVEVVERSVMGLSYREIRVAGETVRPPDRRGYDHLSTNPHLEEAIAGFEEILAEMLQVAIFESRMKRIGEEILRGSRRIRVLEERHLPSLRSDVKKIAEYIGERERESYCRLKQFKQLMIERRPQSTGSEGACPPSG